MKTVIILGSSRSNGDTAKVANELSSITKWELIDLSDYNFSCYDYQYINKTDDYLNLMRRIISDCDALSLQLLFIGVDHLYKTHPLVTSQYKTIFYAHKEYM